MKFSPATYLAVLAMSTLQASASSSWAVTFGDAPGCDGSTDSNKAAYSSGDASTCIQIGAPGNNCTYNFDGECTEPFTNPVRTMSWRGDCKFFADGNCNTPIALVVPVPADGQPLACLDVTLPVGSAFQCNPVCDDFLAEAC